MKHLILHGHFYQPPREDPWDGVIEYQESAHPFENWNKRITEECYAANAWSKVLDDKGFITSIVNNYEYLSFNFGPTLLTWLKENAPNVYRRIIEADRKSTERLGHGNAIAQSFNHTILPLDSKTNAGLQIDWGLKYFKDHFNRNAEGMWLPECAVNEETADILISRNIKFIVLSPWQAESVQNIQGEWISLNGLPAPSERPYFIKRDSGELAVFFYDPDLASAISFGHLLRSRENFENAVVKAMEGKGQNMISIATDGEIYGHHEPFGDMCISSFIKHIEVSGLDFIFTNYASYLELYMNNFSSVKEMPEVRLKAGEDNLGSSWSCSHGVGRWFRDCGCSTGGKDGWNQKWRTPLRTAFNNLNKTAERIWRKEIENLCHDDPVKTAAGYAEVLSGSTDPLQFSLKHLKEINPENTEKLLRILEGIKYLNFMNTSCGWFFADISGLEPVQDMRYAWKAAELLDPENKSELKNILINELKKAQSNIKEEGNGFKILEKYVIPANPAEINAAAVFIIFNSYVNEDFNKWGIWEKVNIITEKDDNSGNIKGKITIKETSILKEFDLVFTFYRTTNTVKIFSENIIYKLELNDMPLLLKVLIKNSIKNKTETSIVDYLSSSYKFYLENFREITNLNIPEKIMTPDDTSIIAGYIATTITEFLKETSAEKWPSMLKDLKTALKYSTLSAKEKPNSFLEEKAAVLITEEVIKLSGNFVPRKLELLTEFVSIIHESGLFPLKPYIQNTVYSMYAESAETLKPEEKKNLIKLAEMLNIAF